MNVQIRDPVFFQHLSHLDARAYLAGQQWAEAGRIDNRPRHVSVKFEQAMFDRVIHAFRDRIPIRLDGDLFPIGQRYELGNPRNLTLIRDADEPNPDNPSDAKVPNESCSDHYPTEKRQPNP